MGGCRASVRQGWGPAAALWRLGQVERPQVERRRTRCDEVGMQLIELERGYVPVKSGDGDWGTRW